MSKTTVDKNHEIEKLLQEIATLRLTNRMIIRHVKIDQTIDSSSVKLWWQVKNEKKFAKRVAISLLFDTRFIITGHQYIDIHYRNRNNVRVCFRKNMKLYVSNFSWIAINYFINQRYSFIFWDRITEIF